MSQSVQEVAATIDLTPSSVPDSQTLQAALGEVLSEQHETFASQVACGKSFRQAAKLAGFHEQWGWRIMQMPAVRARVAELLKDTELRDRAALDSRWTLLANKLAEGDLSDSDRADIDLNIRFLMSFAKYKGYIKERKQVERLNVSMSRDELQRLLDGEMAALPIAQRKQVEAQIKKLPAAK